MGLDEVKAEGVDKSVTMNEGKMCGPIGSLQAGAGRGGGWLELCREF
jgi:hypothetical protein